MNQESILIVFKDKKKITKNQDFWIDKFKKQYIVHHLFLYDFLHLTNKKIAELVNSKIKNHNINIILFEGDHMSLIDYNFIKNINNDVKKGSFLGDDSVWHQVNLITASACDFVLTDPVSAYKFEELGIRSIFSPVEGNNNIFKDYKNKKEIDVLFFGRDKTDRNDYLRILEDNKIKYLSVNPYMEISDTIEKLAVLINKSKIVINISKSLNGNRFFNPSSKFKFGYYFKGRPLMVGLCKTLCISEYSISNEILYSDNELPMFKNKDDFIKLVRLYLSNSKKLEDATKLFHERSLKYADDNYIEILKNFFDKTDKTKIDKVSIPFWYYIISLKQHFRLRSKLNQFSSLIHQFYENLNLPIYILPINIIFFLRYLPVILFKKVFKRKND